MKDGEEEVWNLVAEIEKFAKRKSKRVGQEAERKKKSRREGMLAGHSLHSEFLF